MKKKFLVYLTIRQRGRVVYQQIVDEGETRVDYLLTDNEVKLSNCFSIHSHLRHKLQTQLLKIKQNIKASVTV